MIRVGFVLTPAGWLGGLNYLRNLFSALSLLEEKRLQVVLFVGSDVPDDVVNELHHVQVVRSAWLNSGTMRGLFRRALNRLSGYRDPILRWLLNRDGIDVLSHYSAQWAGGGTRKIGWIPDFQHVYLPQFFSAAEISRRDIHFRRLIRSCDLILLSSESAQRDLAKFFPGADKRSAVLRFVPEVDRKMGLEPLKNLEIKYDFTGPFFFIPNQFWVHKNHDLVVGALEVLKAEGFMATVLLSGNTRDYRCPNHYRKLMDKVRAAGVGSSFRVLGVIPYADLISLMENSVALINPSLFEGWSSTVEEAKALGKTILLSDLPVHREQNPDQGIYFNPNDVSELAEKMKDVLTDWLAAPTCPVERLTLTGSYHARRVRFAVEYQAIVERVMNL